MTVIDGIEQGVATVARGITRRRLLRRAGKGALGVAFGTAYLWHRPLPAYAGQFCSGARCNETRCYDTGRCHCTCRTRPATYQGWTCNQCGDYGCWITGSCYRCCDCCVDYVVSGVRCGGDCPGGGCSPRAMYECACVSNAPVC